MITVDHYSNHNGFENEGEARELLKAMSAGHITGRDTTDLPLTQEPLKAESLETTLKLLTYRLKDIKLWNAIPKLAAYNTVEEFLTLESYGSDRGGFYDEGELSDVEDSIYRRKAEYVKYIQVTGEVTLQAQMVRSFVPAMQKEVQNKIMWILRKVNTSLTKADSSIVPQEFNSIYKQHASIGGGEGGLYIDENAYYGSDVVIDMRGKAITQETIEDAAIRVDANYGNVSDIFAPPSVTSDLAKNYFEVQRIMQGGSGFSGTIGVVPQAIDTSIGKVNLNTDKLMKSDAAKTLATIATSLKAPASVVADVTTPAALAVDSYSKFTTAEGLGDVKYAVSAVNKYGESALTAVGGTITLANGSSVDLKFAAGTGGGSAATGFIVYRTKAGDLNTFYPILKISAAKKAAGYDGAAAGLVRDRNRILPGTESAFVCENSDEVMSFKQLAPLSKLDLARLSLSNRFITFLFGTPVVYAHKKMLRIINIGRRA